MVLKKYRDDAVLDVLQVAWHKPVGWEKNISFEVWKEIFTFAFSYEDPALNIMLVH